MNPSPTELATLITAVGAVIIGIIGAFRGSARDKKLDKIHHDTNGSLSALKKELADTRKLLQAQYKKAGIARRANQPKSK